MRAWFHRSRLHAAYHPHIPRPSSVLLHRPAVILAVLAATVALTAAALGAHQAMLTVDEPISELLRSQAWLDGLRWVNQLGSEADGVVIAVVVGVLMWRFCRRFAVALPVAVAVGIALNVTLKFATDRPRPPDPEAAVALASFPSGHVLHATIVFGLLPPALYILTGRRAVFWATAAASGLVVLSVAAIRVHLGAHWPSDVAASMLIGASLLLLTEYAIAHPTPAHRRTCPLHRTDAPDPVDLPDLGELEEAEAERGLDAGAEEAAA